MPCVHKLKWGKFENVIFCDGCGTMKSRSRFSVESQAKWMSLSNQPLYCNKCLGQAEQDDESQWVFCNGQCQQRLPNFHFLEKMVSDCKARDSMLEVRCARCLAHETLSKDGRRSGASADEQNVEKTAVPMFACTACEVHKEITAFGPYAVKDWLGDGNEKCRYHCYDCILPACQKCQRRPTFPGYYSCDPEDGKYYCKDCTFPPCVQCGRQQRTGGESTARRFQADWLCAACKNQFTCLNCSAQFSVKNRGGKEPLFCSDVCRFPPRPRCGAPRPTATQYAFNLMPEWSCKECRKAS